MTRIRLFAMASAVALFAAGPACADFVNSVRAQLASQGYRQVSVTETLLGRSRIVAIGKGGSREIIMNPRTGEILRDLWTSSDGKSGPSIGGSEDSSDDDDKDEDGDNDSDGDGDSDSDGHSGGDGNSGGDGESGGDGDSGGGDD